MNCKPGDLAIIVDAGSCARVHIGKIVRCIRLTEPIYGHHGFGWETLPELNASDDGKALLWRDEHLRPIRDPGDDATDEMVQLLGKPSGVTA